MNRAAILHSRSIFMRFFAKISDSRDFPANADDVFLITLGVLNNLDYKIEEIQSGSGYILFKTPDSEYLLMVSENDNASANVKIQKVKKPAKGTLGEVQAAIYNSISENLNNLPKKAD